MNLDDIMSEQIIKSNLEYQARKRDEAIAKTAEETKKAAEEKALFEKKRETFNCQKEIIESSRLREVLAVLIKGLNSNYSGYSHLKSKLIKMIDRDCQYDVFSSTKYSVNKPYLFNSTENYYGGQENYYLFLQCRDFPHNVHNFFVKFSSKDNKIFLNLEFQSQEYKKYNKIVELSLEKEQMASQIVQLIMDSEVG